MKCDGCEKDTNFWEQMWDGGYIYRNTLFKSRRRKRMICPECVDKKARVT